MPVDLEVPRAAALDGLVREGVLTGWRMVLTPGNPKGQRRLWILLLADGSEWRVERSSLDAMLAIATVALREAS